MNKRQNNVTGKAVCCAGAAVLSGMVFSGCITQTNAMNSAASEINVNVNADSANFIVGSSLEGLSDGIYIGSGEGLNGEIKVQMTISEGKIADLTVISGQDNQPYFNQAIQKIIPEILEKQSVNVGTVSGATFSSNGILDAAREALKNAGASSDSAIVLTAVPTETESVKSASIENGSVYQDGTYTGSGTGRNGTIQVKVTVSGGAITDITVTASSETANFFSRAENGVISEILAQQSVNVNTVSGATFSSNGIIEAVAKALNLDFTNPNASISGNHSNRRGRH